jgi:hypothetical protein
VSLGWIQDGRWWVDLTTEYRGGWVFADDASARAYAEGLMRQDGPPEAWDEIWPEYVPGVLPPQRRNPPPYPPGDPRLQEAVTEEPPRGLVSGTERSGNIF